MKQEVKVLVAQSCLTLCDPMDCSPPGYSSMEFFRQEYWNGLPFPSPGDLPDPCVCVYVYIYVCVCMCVHVCVCVYIVLRYNSTERLRGIKYISLST